MTNNSVEDAIHARWDSYQPLVDAAQLVADRLKSKPEPPYVILERTGSAMKRTSEGTVIETITYRFTVWSADKGTLQTVAGLVQARFNRQSFDWAEGKVLDMRLAGRSETIDGTAWKAVIDYTAQVTNRAGVLA